MGEFDLIADLARATHVARRDVVLGIGDDGAVLRVPAGRELVVAIDTLVEGVHFTAGTDPESIGWKALAVNLSDLAAMGAEPAWATLALTLPHADATWVQGFARGFMRLARPRRVALVGGDTTRGPLTISVQVHGFVPHGKALRRSGARVGDAVWISGTPGDAAAGLALAQGSMSGVTGATARSLRARLDRPMPRVALGVALRGMANAAIDVSDGLAQDLGHILHASAVGADCDIDALPYSTALRRAVPDVLRRRALALTGGDDYELCFTAPTRFTRRIEAIAARLRVRLTRIGVITRGKALRLHDADGQWLDLSTSGWNHFR